MYSLIILGFTGNCSCLKFTAKLEFVKRFKVSIEVRYPFVLLIFSASFDAKLFKSLSIGLNPKR